MSIFKRLSLSWFAKLDDLVTEIENHQAIIEAALKEHAQKVAEAKVQKNQLTQQLQHFEKQILKLKSEQNNWKRRAAELADSDQESALECVRRVRAAENKIESLNTSLIQYNQAVNRLDQHIEKGDSELDLLRQKLDLLKARQASTNATNSNALNNQDNLEEVQKAFTNWEKKVAVNELVNNSGLESDPFAEKFEKEESEQKLKDELQAILDEQKLDQEVI